MRNFQDAIRILNSRRRQKRPEDASAATHISSLHQMPSIKGSSDMRGVPSIVGMKEWLDKLGHSAADIGRLNVIHIAGTKGKGSTCVFIDSLLRCHAQRSGFPTKRGLYTSPHLLSVTERIRIDSIPVSQASFTKYFFEVHDALFGDDTSHQPRYLQLLFLVALHTFIREGVDVAIIETHHGGEYDATNVIPNPVMTGVTSLGLDHISQLGPSLENIAWHKSGIFKHSAIAVSTRPDDASIISVLERRALEKGTTLRFVDEDTTLPYHPNTTLSAQRRNCSLALEITRAYLHRMQAGNPQNLDAHKMDTDDTPRNTPLNTVHNTIHPDDIIKAIESFTHPGRFQIVHTPLTTYHLDGGHNELSSRATAEWFTTISTPGHQKAVVFAQVSEQRDLRAVLRALAGAFATGEVQRVVFTMYDSAFGVDGDCGTTPGVNVEVGRGLLDSYKQVWTSVHPKTMISFTNTVEDAMRSLREEQGEVHMDVLITGSLHLVGAALFALGVTI